MRSRQEHTGGVVRRRSWSWRERKCEQGLGDGSDQGVSQAIISR
jgi:hypothetical protein